MLNSQNKLFKKTAVELRLKGFSYPQIENRLGINRSTLSGWLSALELPKSAKEKIEKRKVKHLQRARVLAAAAHRRTREIEIKKAQAEVKKIIKSLPFGSAVREALLAMLYLAEGFKLRASIGLGNSNPGILLAFVKLLREIYQVDARKFRCYLHLRSDQDEDKEKTFWSKVLSLPLNQFRKTQFDKRTIGKKTWTGYHGVCVVYCYDAGIEKRLTAFQEFLLKKLLSRNLRA